MIDYSPRLHGIWRALLKLLLLMKRLFCLTLLQTYCFLCFIFFDLVSIEYGFSASMKCFLLLWKLHDRQGVLLCLNFLHCIQKLPFRYASPFTIDGYNIKTSSGNSLKSFSLDKKLFFVPSF